MCWPHAFQDLNMSFAQMDGQMTNQLDFGSVSWVRLLKKYLHRLHISYQILSILNECIKYRFMSLLRFYFQSKRKKT